MYVFTGLVERWLHARPCGPHRAVYFRRRARIFGRDGEKRQRDPRAASLCHIRAGRRRSAARPGGPGPADRADRDGRDGFVRGPGAAPYSTGAEPA